MLCKIITVNLALLQFFLIALVQQSTQTPFEFLHIYKTVNTQAETVALMVKSDKTFKVCNKRKFGLQTTQLGNKCMSSSNQPLHSGQQNTALSVNQCTIACHCLPITVRSFHASTIRCQICLHAKNWIQN